MINVILLDMGFDFTDVALVIFLLERVLYKVGHFEVGCFAFDHVVAATDNVSNQTTITITTHLFLTRL